MTSRTSLKRKDMPLNTNELRRFSQVKKIAVF
jgi:hypothetical protein